VLTSLVPEVPPLAVPVPSVGVESVALAVVAVVAVVVGAVGFVGFVGFVGDDSLAVAESAGSPDPQARAPERRRSEGMRAGRVEVISVHPGRMRDHTPEPRRGAGVDRSSRCSPATARATNLTDRGQAVMAATAEADVTAGPRRARRDRLVKAI
jgi:hypothetical protein